MLLLIACLIACRLIRNHFAVPVREVAMLTSSSCRTRVCCARSVLCRWRAGRSLVGGVRLGPSLNLWALPCLPRAAVWSCACSVVLRDAGPPLARRGGCRVMGWWLSAPPLPQWRGRGFPCASHLCGVGLRTEVGGKCGAPRLRFVRMSGAVSGIALPDGPGRDPGRVCARACRSYSTRPPVSHPRVGVGVQAVDS